MGDPPRYRGHMPKPRRPRPAPQSQLAQMRALAHPLRLQLLELFAREPRTTKQAAQVLGQPPTRLYHHVAALERVGLVRLTRTRRNRGTIEKYFEGVVPAARAGGAAPVGAISHAYEDSGPAAGHVAHTILAEAEAEFHAALRDPASAPPGARPLALRAAVYATRAQITQLQRTWLAALRKLSAEPGPTGRGPRATHRWTLTAAIVPVPLGAPATPTAPTRAKVRPRPRHTR